MIAIGITIAIIFFILGFLVGIITLLMIMFGKDSRISITKNNDSNN